MALDLNMEGVCSLIRSYLNEPLKVWLHDLSLASVLNIGAVLKWGLARLVNEKGARGIVRWDQYNEFKSGERNAKYPMKYCTARLISQLPSNNAILLSTLMSLFSSISAYSNTNGMPPRKISALFSAYIFGLSDDKTFDETYAEWTRATNATEHILLAFIREQKALTGQIPTHLEKFILNYPEGLNISGPTKIAPGIRTEEVTRVRRLARFHSRNLIQSAGTWEVPFSTDWALFFPPSNKTTLRTSTSSMTPPPLPLFTPHYKHLLNIRSNSHLDNEIDDGDMQRFKTVVERDWGRFGESGFKEIDGGKLEFDLSEGERSNIRAKHETMDWGTFATSGFGGRETFAPADLIFHQNISERVQSGPASNQALSDRIRVSEKLLPPFPYDVTPHEEGRIIIDSNFCESWSDILVSSGWARDELKESNFALIQYKSRTRVGEIIKGRISIEGDLRTEDRWCLVEEFVPKEYVDQLREGKKKPSKRISFLRAVRRKSIKSISRPNVTQMTHSTISAPISLNNTSGGNNLLPITSRTVDDSIFSSREGETKLVSASNVDFAGRDSTYANSFTSSTGGRHGHDNSTINLPIERSPIPTTTSPRTQAYGVGETMSSQTRESAFGGKGPIGFVKPPSPKGFLARVRSRTTKSPQPSSPNSPHSSPSSSINNSPLPSTPLNMNSRLPPTPIVETSRSLIHTPNSPLPPIPSNSPTPLSSITNNRSNNSSPIPPSKLIDRQTTYSEESNDPYGGIETSDEEDVDADEGEIHFRGSQSFPKSLNEESFELTNSSSIPQINVQAPSMKSSSSTKATRRLPSTPVQILPSSTYTRRGDNLPPSLKPDAEVPIDEVADPPRKYSGSAVSRMIGKFETKEEDKKGVRLTQYGFNGA